MKFTPIDQRNWPRLQTFYYFARMAPTGYSLTVDIDVTELMEKLKVCGKKFFPTYLWLVTKCLNEQQEFKMAYQGEALGFFDTLTPLYAQFHEDDHTFTMLWAEYDEDYEIFYERYLTNQKKYGDCHGFLPEAITPPPANAYTVSCLPWVSFQHFAVHSFTNSDYFLPSVEAGKIYVNAEKRKMLPLSMTVHHATTDGYHISQFLEALNREIKYFCERIEKV